MKQNTVKKTVNKNLKLFLGGLFHDQKNTSTSTLYQRFPRLVLRAAAAGWQVPAEPIMPRLNSQVLGP